MSRLRPAALLCAVALVLGTGCGATLADKDATAPRPNKSPSKSPSESPAATVTLSFIQQRFDEGTRKAAITVINDTAAPVHVRAVGLDWAGYPGGLQERRYDVPQHTTVDLTYRLPQPDCAGHDPAQARAVVRTTRGVLRLPLDDAGLRFLSRIWKDSCNARLVRRTMTLGYAGPWREQAGASLTGALSLRRVGEGPAVELTQVEGSPIFDLALGQPRRMARDADSAQVPLVVTSGGRCDAHSRAGVTTPFTFRVWARFGDDPTEIAIIAVPDQATQVRLLAFLDRVCAEDG